MKNRVVADLLDKIDKKRREKVISWAKTTAKKQKPNKCIRALELMKELGRQENENRQAREDNDGKKKKTR